MKTMDEIYQEMARTYVQRTGMELGSCDTAVRLYALAAQVYALYVQGDWVARQAFPQTAEGEYLDRHAALRGLERKTGTHAKGVVRFENSTAAAQDRTIPAGTVCMTAGLVRFETVEQAVLPAGALSVDVAVRAVEPGTAGNVSAETITAMAVAPLGVSSCRNPEACFGGEDVEEDEALRERVLATFKRLPNGANAAYYQQQALSFDQVAQAAVVPRPRGVGTVDVVVSTPAGLPDQALLEEMTAYFEQRREIAVDVQVRAPETVTVDVAVQVAAGENADPAQVKQTVEEALKGWFTGHRLGEKVLRVRLGDLVYQCQGVENYVISAPAADVAVEADQLPVLGTLTVGELA